MAITPCGPGPFGEPPASARSSAIALAGGSRLNEVLAWLTAKNDLNDEAMTGLMEDMLAGRLGEAEVAAVLVAFKMKRETAAELAAAAQVLRQRMTRLSFGRRGLL